MMRLYILFFFFLSMIGFSSCNHNSGKTEYQGVYTDEYGNRFILYDDYSGSIMFANSEKTNKITWREEERFGIQCVTISYNGNPEYYYLRKNYLFLHAEDMLKHRCPIIITKLDEKAQLKKK